MANTAHVQVYSFRQSTFNTGNELVLSTIDDTNSDGSTFKNLRISNIQYTGNLQILVEYVSDLNSTPDNIQVFVNNVQINEGQSDEITVPVTNGVPTNLPNFEFRYQPSGGNGYSEVRFRVVAIGSPNNTPPSPHIIIEQYLD